MLHILLLQWSYVVAVKELITYCIITVLLVQCARSDVRVPLVLLHVTQLILIYLIYVIIIRQ